MSATKTKQIGNSRNLIEYFTRGIPGFNHRQFCLEDLYNLAHFYGVKILQTHFMRDGGHVVYSPRRIYIVIDKGMTGPYKVMHGFHEITHVLYHERPYVLYRCSGRNWNLSKCEYQAEIIGALAWMPDREARGLPAEALMARYGVSRETAEFRASLNLWR
jgi:Zn-dependent peptidase ImmA (M78 family)